MKNRVLFAFMLAVLAGCATELSNDVVEVLPVSDVFTATIENPDTKVFVDGDLKTHWTEGDEISIFTSTYNEEYKFDGQTGDLEGSFSAVDDKFHTGASVPTTYAVYPYSEVTSISSEGVITLNLPAVQNYAENSYGLGANTMVAATESKSSKALNFKSLCGYVVVRLYGEGTVKSITLTGNNGEKLAGQATVAPVYGQAPVVTMSETATTSITLDCGEGVELGKTVEDATAFWFAVPPVTFSQGFTIRVTNTDLWSMEKEMKVERTVIRNTKNPLAPLEANFNIPREGNIEFEDANFKAYCVKNFDTNGDGEISYAEAEVVLEIDCNNKNITSLEGIKYFTALTSLKCSSNQLTALDVSKNTALTTLYCGSNQLTSLDVSNNNALLDLDSFNCHELKRIDFGSITTLTRLNCSYNQLTTLDVSKNTAMTNLNCSNNQLTALDVCKNNALTRLICSHNQLTSLVINDNASLEELQCDSNQLSFLDLSKNTALSILHCGYNRLSALDVSSNTALTTLKCQHNQLPSLDLSDNTVLTKLVCFSNQIDYLVINNNKVLTYLDCWENHLVSLDVSNNTELTNLICTSNPLLTEIWLKWGQTINDLRYDADIATIKYRGVDDVVAFEDSNFKAYCVENFDTNGDGEISYEEAATVTKIDCHGRFITSLEGIQYFTAVTTLYCSDNQLTSLNVMGNTLLQYLDCQDNQLSALDISGCSSLIKVKCYSNQLASLNVSGCLALKSLGCYENTLTSLDVSENTELKELFCNSNLLTSLDVSKNAALKSLICNSNQLTTLDVSNNPVLGELSCISNPQLTEIWLQRGQTIEHLQYDENVSTIKYRGVDDVVAFADANFKAYCVQNFDTNGDGEISYAEAEAVSSIYCSARSISSLEGIQYFTALTELWCNSNQLSSLDVSSCTALIELWCQYNQLTSLDVSSNTTLSYLKCQGNQLTTLDVSDNTTMINLQCQENQLASLDVSGCSELQVLMCHSNQLTHLDVSHNTALRYLDCRGNQLAALGVSNNTALTELYCSYNQLTSLNVSNKAELTTLKCAENHLTTLNAIGCASLTYLDCSDNNLTTLNASGCAALIRLYCSSNQLTSLDVSNNTALGLLYCYSNPYLTEIWLRTGQTIAVFRYDTDVATIYYK